jgi:hypothetical protein
LRTRQNESPGPGNSEGNRMSSRSGRRKLRFAVECGRRSILAKRNSSFSCFRP